MQNTTKTQLLIYACLDVIHFVFAKTIAAWQLAAGVATADCNPRQSKMANNHGSMPNSKHVLQSTGVKITSNTILWTN